tara:strand:+ start:445 stop:738 length:294 start_codon:yes stop_codon:yes gene_type:complete
MSNRTITAIRVYNVNIDMDPELTESDAKGYAHWLENQLRAEYPNAEIDVSDETQTYALALETSDGEETIISGGFSAERDEVEQFLADCWDRCPWTWV